MGRPGIAVPLGSARPQRGELKTQTLHQLWLHLQHCFYFKNVILKSDIIFKCHKKQLCYSHTLSYVM